MESINIRKIIIIMSAVLLLILGIITVASSAYSIGENEKAVVETFGVPQTIEGSGLRFKIPFIQKVRKVDTTIKGLGIGYDLSTGGSVQRESLMITSDYNFVNIDFFIEYKVTDPIKALYTSYDPVLVLKNLAQSYIRDTVGIYGVDAVITTGKNEIQAEIKQKIVERLDKEDLGIQLVNINIQDAEPPTELVSEAFKAVETAKQDKETAINKANKYKNEQLPEAEASIDKILKDANATKQARINEASGQESRFNSLYAEYKNYPLVTKQRMFYEAINEILPGLEVIVDSGNGIQKVLPLDEFSTVVNNANNIE